MEVSKKKGRQQHHCKYCAKLKLICFFMTENKLVDHIFQCHGDEKNCVPLTCKCNETFKMTINNIEQHLKICSALQETERRNPERIRLNRLKCLFY